MQTYGSLYSVKVPHAPEGVGKYGQSYCSDHYSKINNYALTILEANEAQHDPIKNNTIRDTQVSEGDK